MEYYVTDTKTRKRKYLGKKDYKFLVALQHKKLAERYVKILKNNIECKEKFCRSYISDTLEDVINGLPFAYCKTEDIWDAGYSFREEVKKAFQEAGIEIPYPHMDVKIEKE